MEKAKEFLRMLRDANVSLGDAALTIGSGMAGSAVGGLHALGTLARGKGVDEARKNLESTQEKLTWAPRSEHGARVVENIGAPFQWVDENLIQPAADATFNTTGSPGLAAGVFTLGSMIDPTKTGKGAKAGTKASARAKGLRFKPDEVYDATGARVQPAGPITVRHPVEDVFGGKAAAEGERAAKVERATKREEAAQRKAEREGTEVKKRTVARTEEERAALPPDYFRTMFNEKGEQAVIDAATRGEHIRRAPGGGFVGMPRTVRNRSDIEAMRAHLDVQARNAADMLRYAEWERPDRVGTWYPRVKAFNELVHDPAWGPKKQDQWIDGTGAYSAGVAPESEFAFNIRHQNARALGDPDYISYRGGPARTLDEAAQSGERAKLAFKTGEYANKNDPRIPPGRNPFGVNDFRMAQSYGYTDLRGEPWRAGVTDQMHPVMDAENALQVQRANQQQFGGISNWTGDMMQEQPWVLGKAEDLYRRGTGTYSRGAGGMLQALRDANNTAADYAHKHTFSQTHEATPGRGMGHREDVADMPFEQQRAYADEPGASWIRPEDNKDVLISALGLRQIPAERAVGNYMGDNSPVTISRPLVDFEKTTKTSKGPEGENIVTKVAEGGTVREPTMNALQAIDHLRGLVDAQAHMAGNLPVQHADRPGMHMLMETDKFNPATGNPQATQAQMSALSEALRGSGFSPSATSRGVQLINEDFNPEAFNAAKQAGAFDRAQAVMPGARMHRVDQEGYYFPTFGPERGTGQYTSAMLESMAGKLRPVVSDRLAGDETIRSVIRQKMLRDEGHPMTREDLQRTRQFLSEGDWGKVVDLIRKGVKPAAAVAAVGYSLQGMAAEQPQQQ